MPPPQVICSICGETVNKAQTYATGEKDSEGKPLRACKKHEGVAEKAEELKEKAFEKQEKNTYSAQQKREREHRNRNYRDPFDIPEDIRKHQEWAETHCWCCEGKGVSIPDFSMLQLVAMEKAELLGIKNPFDPALASITKSILKKMGYSCVLHRFSMDKSMREKYQEWKNRINHKMRGVVELGNIIQLCFDCQKKTGIEYDVKTNMPKFDLQTMAMIGSAYLESGMKENMKEIAKASIFSDRESEEMN
jgi:hypothetical protein